MALGLGLGLQFQRKGGTEFNGLFDQFNYPALGFSMRWLGRNYTGGLVRVRAFDATSDQGTADVMPYQIGGEYWVDLSSRIDNLDAIATGRGLTNSNTLADLVSSGVNNYNGFVTTWYNQGTPNHATQTTASAQPQIVSSGNLVLENGKPALQFGGNDYFAIPDFNYGLTDQLSVISVTDSGEGDIINQYNTTLNERSWRISIDGSNKLLGFYSTNGVILGGIIFDSNTSTQRLNFTYFDTNNATKGLRVINYTNGIQQATDLIQNPPSGNIHDSTASIAIGAVNIDTSPAVHFNGKMQEIAGYASDKIADRLAIQDNVNSAYSIYP